MRYLRCKCGKSQGWESGGCMPACGACPHCGSDLAEGPNQHREPVPHEYSEPGETVETTEGPKLTPNRCRYCHRTEAEVTAATARAKAKGGAR